MAKKNLRNELVPTDGGFLADSGPILITERSFAFQDGATEEIAFAVAARFRRQRGMAWILGDFLIASEGLFAGSYEQLENETGFDYQTMANAKSLCKRFPVALRLWDLSPSFYEVVAVCDDATVKKYLDMAVDKGFARDDFRDYVKEERAEAAKKDRSAGVGTGTSSDGAAGIGTGKPAAIKVEPSPKSLATIALDHLTQEQRGELASLILANTTADQTKAKKYDLAIADQFPVSMLLFAIERRVAQFDQDATGAALLKQVRNCGKIAERFEAEAGDTSAPAVNIGKGAGTASGSTEKGATAKNGKSPAGAPKAAGKGKSAAKKADTAPVAGDDPDGLPVREIGDDEAALLEGEGVAPVSEGEGVDMVVDTDGDGDAVAGFPPGVDPAYNPAGDGAEEAPELIA